MLHRRFRQGAERSLRAAEPLCTNTLSDLNSRFGQRKQHQNEMSCLFVMCVFEYFEIDSIPKRARPLEEYFLLMMAHFETLKENFFHELLGLSVYYFGYVGFRFYLKRL